MKGDFSRVTFDPEKQFSRVLMQQGRVQVDADWNEQADILLHAMRTLAADLIGPFAAPAGKDGAPGEGFKVALRRGSNGVPVDRDFVVLPGRYYVDGIAAENPRAWIFSETPGAPLPGPLTNDIRYLLLLDVWERHVSHLQDDSLREVALLGADTATRSKVVWQVRAADKTPDGGDIPAGSCRAIRREWSRWVERLRPAQRGQLKARARPGKPDDTDPCLAAPEARFRGENQLYRVEIHAGAGPRDAATYKWSADNGSVDFAVRELVADQTNGTTTATLESLGRDGRSSLVQGDWAEVVDGEEDLRDGSDRLLQVQSVDHDRRQVILQGAPPANLKKPLVLRRWDHRRGRKPLASGVYPVREGEWLDLEDGVQIFFVPPSSGTTHAYRPGDFWLIPARAATGDVEWPEDPQNPQEPRLLPPHGVEHRFAPLALLTLRANAAPVIEDCRPTFGAQFLRLETGVADWHLTAEPAGSGLTVPRAAEVVDPLKSDWGTLAGARWISAARTGGSTGAAGDYTFELRFDLSAFGGARLALDLLADNSAVVFLNDEELDRRAGPDGFKEPPPATHIEKAGPEFFRAGENVLKVVVTNDAAGPTGLLLRGVVEADGIATGQIPLPAPPAPPPAPVRGGGRRRRG